LFGASNKVQNITELDRSHVFGTLFMYRICCAFAFACFTCCWLKCWPAYDINFVNSSCPQRFAAGFTTSEVNLLKKRVWLQQFGGSVRRSSDCTCNADCHELYPKPQRQHTSDFTLPTIAATQMA